MIRGKLAKKVAIEALICGQITGRHAIEREA